MDADAGFILLDRDAMMVGAEPVASGAQAERIEQDRLQVAAMNGELWILITGRAAQQLLIDQLPEAIEEGRVLCRDRDPRQRGFEAERGQFPGGVREQIDAHANGPGLGGRLIYPAGNSG